MDGQYYLDVALTNMSQAYVNPPQNYISNFVAPLVPVPRPTGKYAYYDKGSLRQPASLLRTGMARTPVGNWSTSYKEFGPLLERSEKIGVTFDELEFAMPPVDPQADAVFKALNDMALDRERNLSAAMSNTSIITQNGSVTTQWNSATGAGTPFQDIETAIIQVMENGIMAPNTIWMGYQVWSQLKNHPDLLDRVKYSTLGVLTIEMFRSLFASSDIANVYVGKAIYDNSVEGATASNGFVWGKNLWVGYVTDQPSLKTVNGFYTFYIPAKRYVDTWNDQDRKTIWVRTNDYYDQFLVGPETIYMLQNCVA